MATVIISILVGLVCGAIGYSLGEKVSLIELKEQYNHNTLLTRKLAELHVLIEKLTSHIKN